MDLTRKETFTFIRLVKLTPILWDSMRGDYCDKEKKRIAWSKIAKDLKQAEGLQAYKRFRHLVSCYAAALTKMKKENKTTSKLFYFHDMDFLRDEVENHLNPLNKGKVIFRWSVNRKVQDMTESNLDDMALAQPDEAEDSDSENPFDSPSEIKENNLDGQLSSSCLDYSPENLSRSSSSKLCANVSEMPSAATTNEYDTFAVHVATQLRQLNTLQAMELMYEIQALLSKKRISFLQQEEHVKSATSTKKLRKPKKPKF